MSRITPLVREIAGRILAHEAEGNAHPASARSAVFQVCERLRPHLSMLMGRSGFRALLSRALTVTSAEVPALQAVTVTEGGSLEGWSLPEPPVGARRLDDGSVLLIAQLLGLLVAFIGDNLTLRLVHDVWPALSLEDLPFTHGDSL